MIAPSPGAERMRRSRERRRQGDVIVKLEIGPNMTCGIDGCPCGCAGGCGCPTGGRGPTKMAAWCRITWGAQEEKRSSDASPDTSRSRGRSRRRRPGGHQVEREGRGTTRDSFSLTSSPLLYVSGDFSTATSGAISSCIRSKTLATSRPARCSSPCQARVTASAD
jgi:hypothetical protein